MAGEIDYSDMKEGEHPSDYQRLVKATAAECINRYGRNVARNLKGVMDICVEHYDASARAKAANADFGVSGAKLWTIFICPFSTT